MKEDFGVIARNSLLLESEQIMFHYQQKKSTKSGWMDLQSSAGQNLRGEGVAEDGAAVSGSLDPGGDRLPTCGLRGGRRRFQRPGGSRPGLVLRLLNSTTLSRASCWARINPR